MKKKLLSLVLAIAIVMSFVVPVSAAKPGVVSHEPGTITNTSVVMRGAVTSNSGIRIKEYGFLFVDNGNVSYKTFVSGKDFEYPDPINNDVIECKKTGLKAGKEYAYQFYAVNENGEKSYGKTVYFTAGASSKKGDTEKPDIDDFDCDEGSSFYVGQKVKFYAETSDNDKVASIVLYIDGKQVKTSDDDSISYKTSDLTVGKHTIKVKVTDASGNYREEDMTVTVKEKNKLAAPTLKPEKSTIKVGETLELSWNSVANADYYTIHVWETGFSQNYFETSTKGYLKKITFDAPGTYAVSIYSRTNNHDEYEQSEPYGINITVVKDNDHSHTTKRANENPKRTQVVGNDDVHHLVVYYDLVCTTCGEVVQKNATDKLTTEKHNFSNNVCSLCGYTKKATVCTHDNTSKKNISKKTVTISGDDTYHNVVEYYDNVCSCGVTVESNVKSSTTKEKHSFSNNVCSKCGYTKKETVCTHQNTSKKNISKKTVALNSDDTYHNVVEYYDNVCSCGVTVESNVKGVTTKEIHSFSNNVCSKCGYTKKETVCTHNEHNDTYTTTKWVAISGDETYHNAIPYYTRTCKYCSIVLDTNVAGTAQKEKHTSDGICSKCGYVKASSIFDDVRANASYLKEITYLNEQKIITGKGNNKFDPNGYLTRAEAATIICKMSSSSELSKANTGFSDVPSSHWASGYIKKAKDDKIINGKGNNKFDPNGKLTGQEFVKMVVCWLGYGDDVISKYGDNAWPKGYCNYARDTLGILKNMPTDGYEYSMKRSDAAVLAYNALFTTKKTSTSSGNTSNTQYWNWKQNDSRWANNKFGTTTMAAAGCAITSAAMLIAQAGVVDSNFNPDVLRDFLVRNSGFEGNNIRWGTISKLVPQFKYVKKVDLSGSDQEKFATIKSTYAQGYSIAVVVKNGGHFVAVKNVTNTKVEMMDPSSSATDLFGKYGSTNNNESGIIGLRVFLIK